MLLQRCTVLADFPQSISARDPLSWAAWSAHRYTHSSFSHQTRGVGGTSRKTEGNGGREETKKKQDKDVDGNS
ncbi:uncharacterized [Tachysurus ichikawai]